MIHKDPIKSSARTPQAPEEIHVKSKSSQSYSSKPAVIPDNTDNSMRLQRFLARAGLASRRESEHYIVSGRVSVNGSVVSELGIRVNPTIDTVTVDGKAIRLAQSATSLIIHKPAGILTTMSDPQARPCIAALLPTQQYPGIFPVGRLDYDVSGLLFCTTDGDLAHAMLHPSNEVTKRYIACVRGIPTEEELQALRKGVLLDTHKSAPAEVRILSPGECRRIPSASLVWQRAQPTMHTYSNYAVIELKIHEGKKHQVKKMLAAIHHPVQALHRDGFGPLFLDDLPEGAWRLLCDQEQSKLDRLLQDARAHNYKRKAISRS